MTDEDEDEVTTKKKASKEVPKKKKTSKETPKKTIKKKAPKKKKSTPVKKDKCNSKKAGKNVKVQIYLNHLTEFMYYVSATFFMQKRVFYQIKRFLFFLRRNLTKFSCFFFSFS